MKRWLPNALGFQLVWLACVAGAGRGCWWAGPAALIVFAIWQLRQSTCARADLVLMACAALLGFALDSAWVQFEVLRFATPQPWDRLAPIWIVSLWIGFGLTLNHSLSMLRSRPGWAMLFGLVGGPLAYVVAERAWAAVEFTQPAASALIALSLAWGLVTPLLLLMANRLSPSEARMSAGAR